MARSFAVAYDDPVTRSSVRMWIGRGVLELVVCATAVWASATWSGAEFVAIAAGVFGVMTTFVAVRARHILKHAPWRKEGLQTSVSRWNNGGTVLRFNDEPGHVFTVFGTISSSLEALDKGSKLLVAGTKRRRVVATLDRRWMRSIHRPLIRRVERRMWRSMTGG